MPNVVDMYCRDLDAPAAAAIQVIEDAVSSLGQSSTAFSHQQKYLKQRQEQEERYRQEHKEIEEQDEREQQQKQRLQQNHYQQQQNQFPTLTVDAHTMQELSEQTSVAIQVFNSLGWNVVEVVEVPCFLEHVVVYDPSGAIVPYDVLPAVDIPTGPCRYPGTCGHANVSAPYTLFFEARVPSLGLV
jgi:hypothetical protein